MKIEVDRLKAKINFRKHFDIKSLAENMERQGQLQPILITSKNIIVEGERRVKAARELGWKHIECMVKDFDTEIEQTAAGIWANIERQSFTKSEEMAAMAWMKKNLKEKGEVNTVGGDYKSKKSPDAKRPEVTFSKKIAEKTGQSETTIKEKARIGENMTKEVAKAIDKNEITQKQAEQVVRLKDKKAQNEVLEKVKGKSLSVTKEIVVDELNSDTDKRTGKISGPKKSFERVDGVNVDQYLKQIYKDMGSLSIRLKKAFDHKAWTLSETEGRKFMSAFVAFVFELSGLAKRHEKTTTLLLAEKSERD